MLQVLNGQFTANLTQKGKEKNVAQLNSRIIAVDSLSMQNFQYGLISQTSRCLMNYLNKCKSRLKFWCGARNLQHGNFADKVNNRPVETAVSNAKCKRKRRSCSVLRSLPHTRCSVGLD